MMSRHMLMLLVHKSCVLFIHAQSVHNRTQILCLGIIHLFLKKMKLGHRQTLTKEVDNAFVLLSAIRNPLLI
jgi:hypothetical protein